MYYYEVLVASQRYHGAEALTYSSLENLEVGHVVTVPFGNRSVPGIVQAVVEKPEFEVKPITKLIVTEVLPKELLSLHKWIEAYYPGPLGFISQLFLPASLTTTGRPRKPVTENSAQAQSLPSLTKEQTSVIQAISTQNGSFLLHGETGSGKTRVYQELVKMTLDDNRSCIVLTPEIGLSSQLSSSFESLFPGRVVVIHSNQTSAEKRNYWKQILRASEPLIIIGPRSALFSPVSNVGLIVLDEAHDGAYKQEQMPYYQTSRVAGKLAALHNAKLVLGTATPSLQDYYVFRQKQLPILRMEAVATANEKKVDTIVVDVKERANFSRSPWISDKMIEAVESSLSSKQQSLLFLNRRGTARLVVCQNCGWQATCPRCDLPLTYHGDTHILRCHTCGYNEQPPSSCPTCQATNIQFKSVGTKTIMDEVIRLFPGATAMRFDSDNPKSDTLERQISEVKDGRVDILVGTQVVSKGLDLPKLSTVGIITADTSLYFPDYTAEERSFQMIRQVIGRVGRGHVEGNVVIQTLHPDSYTLKTAVAKDYEQFYESQIVERQTYRFPPLYFVLKVIVQRAVQSSAKKAAQDISQQILQQGYSIEVSGPSPAFIERAHGKYRWQLVVKAKQRAELIKVIKLLPKNYSYDIDPSDLL
jgi:primosomal protein N' (replication factor Y)